MSQDTNTPTQTNDDAVTETPVEAVIEQEVVETIPVAKDSDRSRWFNVGDTVIVNYKIPEGDKFRIQPYEGIVIAKKGMGESKSFTVRRIAAASVGVERIFPLYSPNIESVRVKLHGKVRRAKLYYMRDRIGKAAMKIKEQSK